MCIRDSRYTDLDTVRAQNREQRELLAQVMPQASFSSETPYRAAGALSILGGYSGENELLGYCVEVQSQGFGGPITMVVGVDLDGKVTGVAVTDHPVSYTHLHGAGGHAFPTADTYPFWPIPSSLLLRQTDDAGGDNIHS